MRPLTALRSPMSGNNSRNSSSSSCRNVFPEIRFRSRLSRLSARTSPFSWLEINSFRSLTLSFSTSTRVAMSKFGTPISSCTREKLMILDRDFKFEYACAHTSSVVALPTLVLVPRPSYCLSLTSTAIRSGSELNVSVCNT